MSRRPVFLLILLLSLLLLAWGISGILISAQNGALMNNGPDYSTVQTVDGNLVWPPLSPTP